MVRATLLGPQRHVTTIGSVASELGWRGPVATITAGWEEREDEDDELVEALGLPAHNLRLFARAESVFAEDPELLAALRERHDRLRALRRLYRQRLRHALDAARELFVSDRRAGNRPITVPVRDHTTDDEIPGVERLEWSDPTILEPAQTDAMRAVTELDRHHLRRVAEVYHAFENNVRPAERRSVRREREAIARELAPCDAVAIAGGHVTVLLNRLRLFGIASLLVRRPVMAWSAGAMALTDHVVLFHDTPPQGKGNPEMFEPGLGLCPDVVALPHASKRLVLDDPVRVSLLARRFAPARCVALDAGSRIDWDGERWHGHSSTMALSRDGEVVPVSTCW